MRNCYEAPRSRFRLSLTCLGLLLASCTASAPEESAVTFPAEWRYPSSESAVTAQNGMVVTTDEYATQVGVEVLRAGGNAIDAAIAVQFALAVVNPEAGNIGGGGFMVVRTESGETEALDYREKAPLAATRDMYLDADGNLTNKSVIGHLAAGVPGTVSGMWAAHERFGTLPWADLVQPAIDLAEGFEVKERFLGSLGPSMVDALTAYPASASQFLPRDGAPPIVGDTLRQLDLAATLGRIRDQGLDGFYAGETATLIVAEMERGDGIMSREDLASYEAAWRDPISFTYRGHTVISMPPSSSGGGHDGRDGEHPRGIRPEFDGLAQHRADPPLRRGGQEGLRGPESLPRRPRLRRHAARTHDVTHVRSGASLHHLLCGRDALRGRWTRNGRRTR